MAGPASSPLIAGLVLAGGQARRMGADKPLMPLGGLPLVSHAVAILHAPGRPLALSANREAARFAFLGLPVLPDRDADFPGPLEGVLAGLRWAERCGASHVLSVPVDCPFLPRDLAARLMVEGQGDLAHAEAGGRAHPAVALWPVALAGRLEAYLAAGERRVMGFMRAAGARALAWDDEAAFANINTPEDLARAEVLLAQRANT